MHDDFDNPVPRLHSKSLKWDSLKDKYGRDDLLPLWVADMDFAVSPAIRRAMEGRAAHPIFGYHLISDEYYDSVIHWMNRHHNWVIDRDWIVFTPGVVTALSYAIKAYSDPGDSIIIQTPVYHQFRNVIERNHRKVVNNPLKYENGRYTMDLADLENKINDTTRILVLCSPHNPVGRVWTKQELMDVSEICLKHNLLIISDEIHFDLIWQGHEHTVLANILESIRDHSIICTAPSKTFNLAGLQLSNVIIPNPGLRNKYMEELEKDHLVRPNSFGEAALIAAYRDSDDWLESLKDYLAGNIDFLVEFIKQRIPQLRVVKPEGTYLLWVDCTGLNMNKDSLNEFFLNRCNLVLNEGQVFGEDGNLFQRFNIACPRTVVEEALLRIEKAVLEACGSAVN